MAGRRISPPATSRICGGGRSAASCLVGEPGLNQRLIGNITLVGGNLDALKKRDRQPEGDRGRRRLEVWKAHMLGLAPVDIIAGVVRFPETPLFRFAPEFRYRLK